MVDEVDMSNSLDVAARPTTSSCHTVDEVDVSNLSDVAVRIVTSSSHMADGRGDFSHPPEGPPGNTTTSCHMVDDRIGIFKSLGSVNST